MRHEFICDKCGNDGIKVRYVEKGHITCLTLKKDQNAKFDPKFTIYSGITSGENTEVRLEAIAEHLFLKCCRCQFSWHRVPRNFTECK